MCSSALHCSYTPRTQLSPPYSNSLPSRVDATEVVQEAISSHILYGSTAFQCFYDLEKAFDSVEYCILLDHLYEAGIDGKTCRLVKSFYKMSTCRVRVNGKLSEQFVLQRGVRQGSVLSPILFLIPLLARLAQANWGFLQREFILGHLAM